MFKRIGLGILLVLVMAGYAYGQATLFPFPKFRAFNSSGNPLASGKVYTYETGASTTPKTTWTNASKETANANPVILDSRGEADIWLDGQYRIVLKNAAGTTQWTVDDVESLAFASHAAVILADQLAGADAGLKIAAAIALLPATGGIVDARRLNGVQTISSQLLVNKAHVTILFSPSAVYTLPTTSGLQAGILVTADDVHLLGERTIFQATKLLADDFTNYWLVRVSDINEEVSGFQSRGIDYRLTVTGTTTNAKAMGCLNLQGATAAKGLVDFEIVDNFIKIVAPDIGIAQKWYGIYVEGEDSGVLVARTIKRGIIRGNIAHECDGRVIQTYHGQHIVVENNIITNIGPNDTYGMNGIRLIGTDDSTVVGNVVTIGSTGKGNCFYFGGVVSRPGDDSKRITMSGNTCVCSGSFGGGKGIHVVGLQDSNITSNTLINTHETGATLGIHIDNEVDLINQDIFIAGNRIRGFSSYQIQIGSEAVRTVVGANYLGLTAAGLSQFLNDGGVNTRYAGWQYDSGGIFADAIKINASGTTIKQIRLTGNVSINPGSINATTRGTATGTFTGCAAGDVLIPLGIPGINDDLIFEGADCSAGDTIRIYLYNPTAGAIDDGAINWQFLWFDMT